MHMEELLKKFLYTGVGVVAFTAEKLQEAVDELVGKGKVSEDEGKKIVDNFVGDVEGKRNELEDRLRTMADNFAEAINLPRLMTREDLEALTARVAAIEAKLGIVPAVQTPAQPAEQPAAEPAK
jgi:polyhydroxyalkanoate synthesis regulator phasin